MLKQVIFIFAIILLVTVGVLKYQWTREESTARFLAVNVHYYVAMSGKQPSSLVLLSPDGQYKSTIKVEAFDYHAPLQWSPDGQWIYFANNIPQSEQTFVQRIHPNGTSLQTIAEGWDIRVSSHTGNIIYANNSSMLNEKGDILVENFGRYYFDWLPNGTQIVILGLQIVDYQSSNSYRLGNLSEGGLGIPAVSSDSQKIAYWREDTTDGTVGFLEWIRIDTGQRSIVTELNWGRPYTWHLDSNHITFMSHPPGNFVLTEGYLYSIIEQKITMTIPIQGNVTSLLWSPDEKWLYYTTRDYSQIEVHRINIKNKMQQTIYREQGNEPFVAMSWSPAIEHDWHPRNLSIGGGTMLLGLFALILRQFVFRQINQATVLSH